MYSVNEITKNYLNEAKVDFVGLWQIASFFQIYNQIKSDQEIKEKSLQVARGLIDNDVCPGYMTKNNDFNFWNGTPDELVAQIAASWPVNGIPNLGTNHCWFAKRSHYDAEGNSLRRLAAQSGKTGT
jgi:hypothetical protein